MSRSESAAGPSSAVRCLPAIERLLTDPNLTAALKRRGRGLVTLAARSVMTDLRATLLANPTQPAPSSADICSSIERHLDLHLTPLPRVLNGTGVVLHSGLGRAPLPPAAFDAIQRAFGYSLLEVERETGERKARDARCCDLLRILTSAEDALVVNNNAAATLLILDSIGRGREIICSRGELVEIGGSFRIPEVMEASGVKLVAVGSTNKTHLKDYERAITAATAALLVVHTSNYRIVGFTSQPELTELSALARSRGLPLIHDLGSGSLLSPLELGVGDEPPVARSLEAGADVVCMSGDKLLGGPQAGIILGSSAQLGRMRSSPLARALRVDKFTVAALEATLQLYLENDTLRQTHPVIRMLTSTREQLHPHAEELLGLVRDIPNCTARLIELCSETGSGALPTLQLPSMGVALSSKLKAQSFARLLRHQNPALFTRIANDEVCIDVRTLLPGEISLTADAIRSALGTSR
ncbi:MAG: L-seryl-tRNA(Sec) selenium transferase [Planctomycetes bacterium]|nr:L-seryl-tRNA(Sec) selenium transferase [Planctomycetota bacterium]